MICERAVSSDKLNSIDECDDILYGEAVNYMCGGYACSAQQYQLLFSEINNPYAYGVVEQNICRMHRCMGQAYRSGDIVTAFGYLLVRLRAMIQAWFFELI